MTKKVTKFFRIKTSTLAALMMSLGFGFAPALHAQKNAAKANKIAPEKAAANLGSASSTNPNDIDSVIAIVNREVITQRELNNRLVLIKKQFIDNKAPLPPQAELERLGLERLIIEEIQYQEAKNRGVRITDQELDGFIANTAAQQKKSMPEFKASIEKQGMSFAKYREDYRRQGMISRIREREVDSKIKISDSDVNNFIAARNASLGIATPTEGAVQQAPSSATPSSAPSAPIHLAQILVPISEGASASEIESAREKAQQILTQAQAEKDFVGFSNRMTKADPRLRAQDLGLRTSDRLPSLFVEATQQLGVGQFANVIQSPAGFHVIKVIDRPTQRTGTSNTAGTANNSGVNKATVAAGGTLIVPQNEIRHILIKARPGQNEEDVARRLSSFRDQVNSKVADFGNLAKKHSEDPTTASNNGLLGWVTPGQLPPEIEQAVANLQPGQVSNPVRTDFGWHLIQLLNRKQTELSPTQQKDYARATLRQQKFDQAYQDWLRELRDSATVELRGQFSNK